MEPHEFEQLLFRGESEVLDFKAEQYGFDRATDEEKSELLKDILAFANAWRDSDAHILIGVEEVTNGRAVVRGVTTHLSDHNLQQFVNSKTQKPIKFNYERLFVNEKEVAVISIPLQNRPFFLTSKFGKLDKEKVYLRRGSSTDVASPDEIAEMGKAPGKPKASFKIKTGFSIQQSPLPEIWLSSHLLNEGNATTYDVLIIFKIEPPVPRSFNYTLWKEKTVPHPAPALCSLHPIHPGSEQHIVSWGIGLIEVGPENLYLTMSGYKTRFDKPVKYTGQDVQVQVTIFARDLSPVTIKIAYTKDEIQKLMPKTFLPTE